MVAGIQLLSQLSSPIVAVVPTSTERHQTTPQPVPAAPQLSKRRHERRFSRSIVLPVELFGLFFFFVNFSKMFFPYLKENYLRRPSCKAAYAGRSNRRRRASRSFAVATARARAARPLARRRGVLWAERRRRRCPSRLEVTASPGHAAVYTADGRRYNNIVSRTTRK